MLNFKLCLEKIGTALCIESNDISELFCTYEAALENGYLKGDLIDNRTGEVLAYFSYDIRNAVRTSTTTSAMYSMVCGESTPRG
jgi:hypothetical protein